MEVVPGTVKTTYHKWQDLLIPRHVPGSQGASGIIPRLEVLNLAVDMQEVAGKKALSPLDIIFSCCICQDTPSRIYEEPDDRLALRQNKDRQWGRIAKLYLTGCAHVVCTKHFEGGGVPFHPMEQRPRAPCPYCKQIKAGNEPQELYALQGPAAGEHDPGIPQAYFDIAPAKLNNLEMEALRFQYVSMLRFASAIDLKRAEAECKAAKSEEIATYLRALRDQGQDSAWSQRFRKMKQLRAMAGSLQTQLEYARDRLKDLGQDVTSIDKTLSYQDISVFDDDQSLGVQDVDAAYEQQQTAASTRHIDGELRLARSTADDLANLNRATNLLETRSSVERSHASHAETPEAKGPVKRKREATPRDPPEQMPDDNPGIVGRMNSRDAMPPPQLPLRNMMPAQTPHRPRNLDEARGDRSSLLYQPPTNVRAYEGRVSNAMPLAEAWGRQQRPSAWHTNRHSHFPDHMLSVVNDELYDEGAIFPFSEVGKSGATYTSRPAQDNLYYPSESSLSSLGDFQWPVQPSGAGSSQPGKGSFDGSRATDMSRPQMEGQSYLFRSQDRGEAVTLQDNNLPNQWYPGQSSSNHSGGCQISPLNLSTLPYRQPFLPGQPTNDGELDNILHPTPQRPIYRPASVSPNRGRITLPPTPRNTSDRNLNAHSSAGLLSHVRSSSTNAHMLTPTSTASHRQQLGIPSSNGPPVSSSPYFSRRSIIPPPQHQPTQRSHSTALSHPNGSQNTASQFPPVRSLLTEAASPCVAPQSHNTRRHQRPFNEHNPALRHQHVHPSILQPPSQSTHTRSQPSPAITPRPPGEDLGSRYSTATGFANHPRQPSARMDPQVLNSLSFLNEPTVGNENLGGRRKARR